MRYREWDINATPAEHTFSVAEIEGIDYLYMIFLNERGTDSTYTLPFTGVTPGKTITVRNRDFGYQTNSNYCGVKFILHSNPEADRSFYWFYFKDQTISFTFNGSYWICNNPRPLPVAQPNFIKDFTEYGYLNLKDYTDPLKSVLFRNLDLSLWQENINGVFFRHGKLEDFSQIKPDTFVAHNHIVNPHTHEFPVMKNHKVDIIAKLKELKDLADFDYVDWLWIKWAPRGRAIASWFCALIQEDFPTDEISIQPSVVGDMESLPMLVRTTKYGGEETRPKNIQGSYVIKAF